MTFALWPHRRILDTHTERDVLYPVPVARDAFLERQMILFALRENLCAHSKPRPCN